MDLCLYVMGLLYALRQQIYRGVMSIISEGLHYLGILYQHFFSFFGFVAPFKSMQNLEAPQSKLK